MNSSNKILICINISLHATVILSCNKGTPNHSYHQSVLMMILQGSFQFPCLSNALTLLSLHFQSYTYKKRGLISSRSFATR